MKQDPSIEKIFNSLPENARDAARFIWDSLNTEDQYKIRQIINNIPSKSNLLKLLIDSSVNQTKAAFGNKKNIAIVGPANAGKSTLFNQFIVQSSDEAEVSPIPGTTKSNQNSDAGIFSIVDTPGADAVGEYGEKEKKLAFEAVDNADFLLIIFDASQGIRQSEKNIFDEVRKYNKPYIVLLNKVDLLRSQIKITVENAAANLKIPPEQIIPISAKKGENLDKILISVAVTEPEIMTALGQALPQYRWQIAWKNIISAASISGMIAITPIPVVDFAPLIVNQSVMVLGIARIYHYEITLKRARELVVTFGLGYLGRTLFYELSKLGGIPGWFLSIAIAVSTTVAMGYAAAIWFEKGEKLSSQTIESITREITSHILSIFKKQGVDKSDNKQIKQRLSEALESLQSVGQKKI